MDNNDIIYIEMATDGECRPVMVKNIDITYGKRRKRLVTLVTSSNMTEGQFHGNVAFSQKKIEISFQFK